MLLAHLSLDNLPSVFTYTWGIKLSEGIAVLCQHPIDYFVHIYAAKMSLHVNCGSIFQ